MILINESKLFDGRQLQYLHESATCNCQMRFSVYLPPAAATASVPALYWLSGLTSTDENFSLKSGAQRVAAELGIALIMPDTSPRGEHVPGDDSGSWDLGHGAGFYVNATEPPWDRNYRMYDYVVDELPVLIEQNFPVSDELRSISGHSMGGHGALVIGLRNPARYRSISAFAPIVSPTRVPWGEKAFSNYLGADEQAWLSYDACHLLTSAVGQIPIKIDQGASDSYLNDQLQPWHLTVIADQKEYPLDYQLHDGYDHSFYFINTFIEDHIRFHGKSLMDQ